MSVLRRARARLRIGLRRRPGVAEAGRDAGRRTGYALHRLWVALRGIARRTAPYLTALASLPIVIAAQLVALASRIGAWIGRRIDALSVIVRPELALAAVAAACCVALGTSQFLAYAGVEVDAPAYSGEIGRVAPAPITDARDIGSAHAYVLLPLAVIGLLLVAATLRGRWRFGRLVALCGLIGIAVSLIIDLPQGLDAGRAGVAYEGSAVRLLEGFYAQLAASASLLFCGVLLGTFVRRAQHEHESRRHRPPEPAENERRRLPNPLDAARSRWRTS